ncbi:putative membrane protein [Bacillus subtilis]|uniref:Putative membrane protein n=1 Tax=Bacillus subtilis TaxID=1423 RepID=A0A0D1IA03_BACIU|nr:putative membrane protein [Bacillus subtilis]
MNEKIDELNKRVGRLEQELESVKREIANLAAGKKEQTVVKTDEHPKINKETEVPQKTPAPRKENRTLENMAGNWLPKIFIFVFLLGMIWAFVAAAEKGWINAYMRVGAGLIVSIVLYVLGSRSHKKNASVLGSSLLAGSNIVYIVSLFAGNMLYQIIPTPLTMILLAAGVAGGVYISRKYRSQTLIAIIVAGVYLYPFLFGGKQGNEYIFYVYESLVFAGLIYETVKQKYSVAWNIANYAFILAIFAFLSFTDAQVTGWTLAVFILQQAITILSALRSNSQFKKAVYLTAVTIGALVVFITGVVLYMKNDTVLYVFYTAAFVFYLLLSLWKSKEFAEIKHTFFLISMIYFNVLAADALSENVILLYIIFTLQGIMMCYVSYRKKSWLIGIAGVIVLLQAACGLIQYPARSLHVLSIVSWLLLISSLFGGYLYSKKIHYKQVTTVVSSAVSLLLLVFFSKLSIWMSDRIDGVSVNVGVSLSWFIFVIVMYAVYYATKDKTWNRIGLIFLFITLAKIILTDSASIDIVWRAVLFILLGVIGLFISRVFYSKRE